MTEHQFYSLIASVVFSVLALGISIYTAMRSRRTRQGDSFAKLYDEFNTSSFGAEIERIGEWTTALLTPGDVTGQPSESDVRRAYRDCYQKLIDAKTGTKLDPLENARRTVKAWFIKCLLYYEARDLSANQLNALITPDRTALMLRVFSMTREQTDVWKRLSHDPTSRNSSDEQYFARLERITSRYH